MAGADYKGIIRAIQAQLASQTETSGTRVFVEENPQFGMLDLGQCISIYLLSRTPAQQQVLAAGKRSRFHVKVAVTSYGLHLERFEEAEALRDALLSNVELVLMRDRTLGGKVNMFWLEGGEFASARAPGGSAFVAAADTILVAEVDSITT